MSSHWHDFELSLLVKILSPPFVWTNRVSTSVQSLMLDSNALFLTAVAVEAESSMIQLGSIMSSVDGKHWAKDTPTYRMVTPLLRLSVDGHLTE